MGYMDVEKAIKTAAGMDDITTNDRLVWFVLAHRRNSKTGKCFPSIETIMEETGLSRSSVKRSKDNLEELGVLKIVQGGGRVSNNYHLLIYHVDEEQVRLFPVENLDALPESPLDGCGSERTRFSENPQGVQRESSGGSERTCSRSSENPESGILTPEGNRGVKLSKAIASASANAEQVLTPHSAENGTDRSKDSGSYPNPQVSSVQANIPMNPLIIDTPWEQENEDALLVWKTSYARPYVLDDFLLIEAEFGQRIKAVLEGHGSLPLIIKWACQISKDSRKNLDVIKITTELRQEFSHILLMITGYILAGELTPHMFMERVENVYLANLTVGHREPDPMDVFEEEYMNYCDENETVMTDMFNPWGEDDAKETQTGFYP